MFLQAFFMGLLFFIAGLFVLIFSLAYMALRKFQPARTAATPIPPPGTLAPPGTTILVCFALIMAGATFLIRACRLPVVLNMHLGDFAQYILMFTAGILAARKQWLSKLSFQQGITWLALVTTVGPAAWLAMIGNSDVASGYLAPAIEVRVAHFECDYHILCAQCCHLPVNSRPAHNSLGADLARQCAVRTSSTARAVTALTRTLDSSVTPAM